MVEGGATVRIIDYTPNSTVDGVGVRQVFWTAGCPHHCEGCHNPQTWEYKQGTYYTPREIASMALQSPYNVTFSGGDPFIQSEDLREICAILERSKTIWVYTGYTWEELLENEQMKSVLEHIDVLVDGRFVEELRDSDLLFRGSSNQRLIDVQKSLREGCVCELKL